MEPKPGACSSFRNPCFPVLTFSGRVMGEGGWKELAGSERIRGKDRENKSGEHVNSGRRGREDYNDG